MMLQQLYYETLKNDDFDPTSITISNLSNYNLSADNYTDLEVSIVNNEPFLYIKGKNKWTGLTICGTRQNIAIVDSDVTTDCNIYNFAYSGDYKVFTASLNGNYIFEAWGASGGGATDQTTSSHRGLGGYTKGQIYLNAGEVIYIYVGSAGTYGSLPSKSVGWNGGGTSGRTDSGGGGGATDFRLTGGDWYNLESLYSRIMVAAGGGGSDDSTGTLLGGSNDGSGGAGGGLIGGNTKIDGVESANTGGTQTMGTLGKGQNVTIMTDTGGAGGGYRGGFVTNNNNGGAGGGSSFISGYPGCDAIDVTGANTGQPNHYSGKIFTNMVMIAGTSSMTSPTGTAETGHAGNGYARLTYLP